MKFKNKISLWLLLGGADREKARGGSGTGKIPYCDGVNTHVKTSQVTHIRYVYYKFKKQGNSKMADIKKVECR